MSGAGDLGGNHVVTGLFAHDGRTRQAHEVRLEDERDRDHGVDEARPKNRDKNQGEQQRREGEDDVHHAHDDGIDPATEVAGDDAKRDAADERQRRDDDADEQREARAVDQTGQHVAADGVGTEQVAGAAALLPDRRNQNRITVLRHRIMGRDPRRKDRQQNEEQEEHEADDGAAVLGEIIPELGQSRPAGRIGRNGACCSSLRHDALLSAGYAD
ncbi:hypothetical protein D9M68_696580 [compost metagenome]